MSTLTVFGYDRSGGALYRSEVTVPGEVAARMFAILEDED